MSGPQLPVSTAWAPDALILVDVRGEVLHLAERDQLVAHHLHVGPELGQEGLHVALDRLPEEIVLVQEIDLGDVLRERADHRLRLHADVRVHAEVPVAALLVGQLGGDGAAIDVDDAVVGIALVVLVHRLDQRGGDVRARALHDDGHVLVGRALERQQRIRRLRLVVEGDELELPAEGAAAAIDPVDDVLELLEVLIADLGEGARERVGVGDLDRALGPGEVDAGREAERQRECDGTPREPVEHGPSIGGARRRVVEQGHHSSPARPSQRRISRPHHGRRIGSGAGEAGDTCRRRGGHSPKGALS